MDLIMLLYAYVLAALLPSAIGQRVLGRNIAWAECYAVGLLVLAILSAVLGLSGSLTQAGVQWFVSLLGLIHAPIMFDQCCRGFVLLKKLWSKDGVKALIILCGVILFVRCLKTSLPLMNWDSLGYHFLQLKERLLLGDLSAMYHVPTDRRSNIFGVLVKIWAFAFDENGRSLVFMNLCAFVASLQIVFQWVVKKLDERIALFFVAALLSLTDMAVYVNTAGDEAIIVLALVIVIKYLFCDEKMLGKTHCFMGFAFLGMAMAMKMTAIFWVPGLSLLWLWKFRQRIKWILGGVTLMLLLGGISYVDTWKKYEMIYPFTRWSNLLYMDGEGEKKMYQVEEVRAERANLGLEKDVNDRSLAEKIASNLFENLRIFICLPLGPYMFWWLLFLPLMLYEQKNRHSVYWSLFLISMCLGTLIIWPLSSQAMMRYHMPMWFPLIVIMMLGIWVGIQKLNLERSFKTILLLLLSFTLLLEAKVMMNSMREAWGKAPRTVWFEKHSDGPLFQFFDDQERMRERVFYFGSAAYLFNGGGHCYAQLGNEVGWRSMDSIKQFLTKQKLSWWAIGASCAKLENPYRAMTDLLIKDGWLKLIKEEKGNFIYRIQLAEASSTSK